MPRGLKIFLCCVFMLGPLVFSLGVLAFDTPPVAFVAVVHRDYISDVGAHWELNDVGHDRYGNVYAVGTQRWRLSDADPWQESPCAAKWDSTGNLLWNTTYDLGADDYEGMTGAIDEDGFVYIGGRKGISLYLLLKCNPDGELLWWKTRTLHDDGVTGDIGMTSLRIDGEGNLVCVGYAGSGGTQVVKYDSDGNELWGHFYNLSETAVRGHLHACGIGADNEIYVGTNCPGEGASAVHITDVSCEGTEIWLADNSEGGSRVCLYDPTTNVIVRTLPNPSSGGDLLKGVAWDGVALWVACASPGGGTVFYGVDPMTGVVLDSVGPVLAEACGLTWDGSRLCFGNPASTRVDYLDPSTGSTGPLVAVPNGPRGVASISAELLFVTGSDNTYLIEVATGTVLQTLPNACSPQEGLAYDGDHLWMCNGGGILKSADPQLGGAVLGTYFPFPGTNVENGRVTKIDTVTGGVVGSTDIDPGPEEQVMAIDGDSEGNVVAVSWLVGDSRVGVTKLDEDLNIIWSHRFSFSTPAVVPREVSVGLAGRIYVAGKVGLYPEIWENDEDSHVFTLCLDTQGNELWRDVFDAGGPTEKEWANGASVSASDHGGVYTGGSLSFSGNGWYWGFCVLRYEEAMIPTSAVFRVERATGNVAADGAFHAPAFHAGSADIAESVSVSEPVSPGDVLELDPTTSTTYRLSQVPCSALIAGVVSTKPGFLLSSDGTNSEMGSASPDSGLWTMDHGLRFPDVGPASPDLGLWTMDHGLGASTSDSAPLALTGIVPVKVCDEGGPIQPGDLLVSSSTPGYAMRWAGPDPCPCALVGKALETLTDEAGVILVLLTTH